MRTGCKECSPGQGCKGVLELDLRQTFLNLVTLLTIVWVLGKCPLFYSIQLSRRWLVIQRCPLICAPAGRAAWLSMASAAVTVTSFPVVLAP